MKDLTRAMVSYLRTLFLLSIACYTTNGNSYPLTFGSTTCDSITYNYIRVEHGDKYYLTWYGETLNEECEFEFFTPETDHRICVDTRSYDVQDCDTKLSYYGGLLGDTLYQTSSCGDHPSKFCGETLGTITIKLKTPQQRSDRTDSFTLKIYSNYSDYTVLIAGLCIGVPFCVFIIIIVIIIIRRRRRRRLGAQSWLLRSTAGGTGHTTVTSSSSGMMGGYTNPNYPQPQQSCTAHAPPPPYSDQRYNTTSYPQKS